MATNPVERSNLPKRRSWRSGKQRHKEKHISIDNMDIRELTKWEDNVSISVPNYLDNLQHPELMSNEKLNSHLCLMKIKIPVNPDEVPNRERLLDLFKTHIFPKQQRCEFWRRRGTSAMPMEADSTHKTGITPKINASWDAAPPLRKRCKCMPGLANFVLQII